MIIFDLDGTLADCEHRRHFVDANKNKDVTHGIHPNKRNGGVLIMRDYYKFTGELWEPDYKSFYEACDKDKLIHSVIQIFKLLGNDHEVQIWSGRCESVRHKTELWLWDHVGCGFDSTLTYPQILKMRPIGDNTPDEILKERWLDEVLSQGKTIDYVFDDRPKVIRMWRRRGIFVFNCCQHEQEF